MNRSPSPGLRPPSPPALGGGEGRQRGRSCRELSERMKAARIGCPRARKFVWRSVLALSAFYLLLLIPAPESPAPAGSGRAPFTWNRDSFWSSLETQFREARLEGCEKL